MVPNDPNDYLSLNEAVRVRDEQLRLAEAAGIGVWDIDIASDTVRGNAQYFRILGLEPTDEPVPMPLVRALRMSDDNEEVVAGFAQAIQSGANSYENEFRILRQNGEVRWVFGRGKVVRNSQGQPIRFSGVDIDITEQKRTAEAERRLAAIVEVFAGCHRQQELGRYSHLLESSSGTHVWLFGGGDDRPADHDHHPGEPSSRREHDPRTDSPW